MAQYDGTLGPLQLGSWFASILYGVAMCKTWEYVDSKKNLQFRKGLLICCMVSCSLAMIGQFASVYYFVGTILVTTIDIIVMTDVKVMSWKEIANTGSLLFTAGMACAGESLLLGTRRLIHRLIVGAIQTGSTTSTVALAMLISGLATKQSSTVPAALSYLIGPMYVLTLLYNLNLRPYDDVGASDTGTDGSLTHPLTRPPLTHPSFTNPACTVDTCMDSIHLQKLCRDEVRRGQQYRTVLNDI
ncbi:hypothetical protein K438DRAFT_1761053 [Mycena galopus ATCC 62051]|nr:hypothetical protein K438DRAFT_1761053 [Mycena galopus ATCC 62051]